MKSRNLLMVWSVAGLMMGAPSAYAASAAVKEMAGIMSHLEHYPSDAEKTKLKAIADGKDSSAQEKAIATAIINLKHKVAAGDADALKKVAGDSSVPAEVRDLANIILSLNHMPSASDKAKLSAMLK